MSAVDRIEKLAVQLYNDLEATDQHLKPWPAPWPEETKQQKLQLILDAFEQVGQVAVDHDRGLRTNSLKFHRMENCSFNAKSQEQTPH